MAGLCRGLLAIGIQWLRQNEVTVEIEGRIQFLTLGNHEDHVLINPAARHESNQSRLHRVFSFLGFEE